MEDQSLNPWFSIWLKPKDTIRMLISSDHERNIFLLILFVYFGAGVVGGLEFVAKGFFPITPSVMSMMSLIFLTVVAAGITLLVFNIETELIEWTGRWLGGQGKKEDIKIVLVWSFIVPLAWTIIISLLLFLMKYLSINSGYRTVFAWMSYIIGIWAFVIYLIGLGEVQRFSIWKALINSVLPFVIIAGPILFVVWMALLGYHHGLGK